MVDPTTVNVALIVPNTGADVGTWGVVALNPDFVSIDGFLGGVVTIGVSNIPVTLTAPAGAITPSQGPTQSQNAVLRFTGAISANVQVTLPLPGYMIIENLTTGAFVLSFRAVGSGQVIGTAQGSIRHIYSDGTNVRFVNLPDPGTYWDLAASTVPAWVSACTVPPWLNCDGSVFSAATYPYLNAVLGGTILPDLRGRNRYSLNQGTGRLTSAGSGIDGNTLLAAGGTNGAMLAANQIPAGVPSSNGAQVIAVTSNRLLIDATGVLQDFNPVTASGFRAPNNTAALRAQDSSGSNAISVVSTNAGQVALGSTTPGVAAGITLIRAA